MKNKALQWLKEWAEEGLFRIEITEDKEVFLHILGEKINVTYAI